MDVSRTDLFRSAARLDENAFETLFLEQYQKIYGVLFRLTGDRYTADDLTAETFWRLWERPPAKYENIAGWLYRVATNLGFNALRARRRRGQHETIMQVDQERPNRLVISEPESLVERKQDRDHVRTVFQRMPLRDVQILVLRHSGLSYGEIAAALEIPASSVGTRLSRAEKKFAELYRHGEKNAPER